MTKSIWKYQLEVVDQQQVLMPKNAKIISAGIDNENRICIWAIVNPSAPKHVRAIRIVGTGNPLEEADMWTFIGTVPAYPFIWHVFDFAYEGGEVEP